MRTPPFPTTYRVLTVTLCIGGFSAILVICAAIDDGRWGPAITALAGDTLIAAAWGIARYAQKWNGGDRR